MAGAWPATGRDAIEFFALAWVTPLLLIVIATAAWWAIRQPSHGLPDRLTGTFLVPR